MSFLLPLLAIGIGLIVLVWSADRFVAGAASLARYFGMAPLLIGMLIVGFGTSAPEIMVSVLSSWQGNPGIALGNAYGSNIANIGLILGLTALLSPVAVHSAVLKREMPILAAVTVLSLALLFDLTLSRLDGAILLVVFAGFMVWSVAQSRKGSGDALAQDVEAEAHQAMGLKPAAMWTAIGLLMLIVSSRLLVWGAVETAQMLGVSDLIIGLTVVAIGTSLPELASSIIAVRRKEHDIALGNVIGSNLFNTLTVVGLAGVIVPVAVPGEILTRDLPVVAVLTFGLWALCYGFGKDGRINRLEGGILLASFVGYTGYLVLTAAG